MLLQNYTDVETTGLWIQLRYMDLHGHLRMFMLYSLLTGFYKNLQNASSDDAVLHLLDQSGIIETPRPPFRCQHNPLRGHLQHPCQVQPHLAQATPWLDIQLKCPAVA